MNIKNTFYVIICDVLYISYVKMNLSQIFRNFQNGRHFEARMRFWIGSCTGIWVIHQDRLCHSLHFEILFDVLAQILTELWLFQNVTYFLILWPSNGTFVRQKLKGSVLWQTTYVDQVWWWLVKNCDLYRGNVTISFKHEYRGHTLTSRCDVIGDVIVMKIILVDDLHTIFYTCCQIEAILKTARFFKLTKIWGPGELFRHKCHRKLGCCLDSQSNFLYFEFLIDVLA